jgi:hypothetical protein
MFDDDTMPALLTKNIQAWYRANLQIAIPVTIGVAVVILLILSGILRCT